MHTLDTTRCNRSGLSRWRMGIGLVIAGSLFAIPALANDSDLGERLEALERRLQELEHKLDQARKDAKKATEPKVSSSIEERVEKPEPAQLKRAEGDEIRGHQVFFRGGAVFLTNNRGGEVFTDTNGASGENNGSTGYYVGGGLDLLLTKNTWGMMSRTWVFGEIGVEYKRFNSKDVTQATSALLGSPQTQKVQLTMLTVDIAPKIMFFEGSRLRPWIIPIGLDFHVISPPSNDVTVLDIGGQTALGLQYNFYKAFNIGIDGRFHLTSNQTDTVNNFGTIGGYLGIGF